MNAFYSRLLALWSMMQFLTIKSALEYFIMNIIMQSFIFFTIYDYAIMQMQWLYRIKRLLHCFKDFYFKQKLFFFTFSKNI